MKHNNVSAEETVEILCHAMNVKVLERLVEIGFGGLTILVIS